MTWFDLLFMYWPVPVAALRPFVPEPIPIDTFDGTAWLGVVPFRMKDVRPRGLPQPFMMGFDRLDELNLRTYSTIDGMPGIYFFNLDASSSAAVKTARILFNLPYYHAEMQVLSHRPDRDQLRPETVERSADGDYETDWAANEVHFVSHRRHSGSPALAFDARYRPVSEVFYPTAGSLEYFLTERYCFYNLNRRGQVYRCNIHHPPWPLQLAHCEVQTNTILHQVELDVSTGQFGQPLLHFAAYQPVIGWWIEKVQEATFM